MPCRSDYQDPTPGEQYRQLTAKLLVHVHRCLQDDIPPKLIADSEDSYCSRDWTQLLCLKMKGLTDHQVETIVYAKNRTARALADWWEDHQEEDRQRASKEELAANIRFAKRYGHTKDKYLEIEKEFFQFES